MKFVLAIAGTIATVTLTGCASQSAGPAPTVTVTATVTATVTVAPTPTSQTSTTAASAGTYPSGDPVLPGYPVLVDTALLDYRVASAITTEKAVALAPGVYSAYVPTQPNLRAYLALPNDGDCAVRELYFPRTGGSCWSGVLPGPQEPAATS